MDMQSQLSSSLGHGFDFDGSEARRYPEDGALEHVGSAIMHELLDVILDTPLEDHLLIAEGLLGGLHTAAQRLEREADKARDEINRGMRDFDGSEVADSELQGATARARACDAALAAVEKIRDAAAAVYTVTTGEVWSPWKGYIRASPATAALMDARDAIRSARAARHAATSPGAVIVAFRASPQAVSALDASRIFDALNWARETWPAMALATTGLKGAEKIAMRWAQQKRVTIVLAKADFNRHGRAAPFRANDEILALDPVHVLTLARSLDPAGSEAATPFGPALNLAQEAAKRGVPHIALRARP
jgi:hypothetical protein